MKRITPSIDPELAKLGFIGTAPVKIEIVMEDGQTFHLENDLARGNPQKPLSDADHTEKFLRNTTGILGEKRAARLLERLFHLEEEPDIADLVRLTTPE